MKTLHVDFAPSRAGRFGLNRITAALLLAGLLGGAWTAHRLAQVYAAGQALRTQAQVLGARRVQAPPRPAAAQLAQPQVVVMNRAVRRLNLPWRDLFDALEAATPTGIALLELDPDAQHQVLQITAEAATSQEMTAYLDALKQQQQFRSVLLKKHEIDAQNSAHPLRFTVALNWRGAAAVAP